MTTFELPDAWNEAVEAAARQIADVALDELFEGDAASEWRHVEPLARKALSAFFAKLREQGMAVDTQSNEYAEKTHALVLHFHPPREVYATCGICGKPLLLGRVVGNMKVRAGAYACHVECVEKDRSTLCK